MCYCIVFAPLSVTICSTETPPHPKKEKHQKAIGFGVIENNKTLGFKAVHINKAHISGTPPSVNPYLYLLNTVDSSCEAKSVSLII